MYHIIIKVSNNLIKEFIHTMNTQTGLPQPLLLEIDGHLMTISQVSPNTITISFDEMTENLRHEVVSYQLNKINTKTVVAAVKGQHPNILKANLIKNPDQLFVLTISVSYQFLPQIKEQIIFSKRQIKPEQSEEAAVINMKNYLRNLKEQVKVLTNIQVLSGQIQPIDNNFQVYMPIPHQNTLISITLTLIKPSNNLKSQLYLFNSATKNRQSTKIMPSEGIFVHHNGQQATLQMRFAVEQSDKYDNAIFVIEGKQKGKYIISLEKLSSL